MQDLSFSLELDNEKEREREQLIDWPRTEAWQVLRNVSEERSNLRVDQSQISLQVPNPRASRIGQTN